MQQVFQLSRAATREAGVRLPERKRLSSLHVLILYLLHHVLPPDKAKVHDYFASVDVCTSNTTPVCFSSVCATVTHYGVHLNTVWICVLQLQGADRVRSPSTSSLSACAAP